MPVVHPTRSPLTVRGVPLHDVSVDHPWSPTVSPLPVRVPSGWSRVKGMGFYGGTSPEKDVYLQVETGFRGDSTSGAPSLRTPTSTSEGKIHPSPPPT